jgi:hypothetical protein
MTTITSAVASLYTVPTNSTSTSVAKTSDTSLSTTAVALASDASVIATLGGSSGSTLVYNAAGVLNELIQAGTSAASSSSADSSATGSTGSQASPDSLDQAIVGSLSASPSTSGIYTADGNLQTSSSTDLTSNWASLLKTNPQLATAATADSFDQGIIGTLSTTA